MARFYSNENVPLGVVECLRSLGHDVLTSVEAGRANCKMPDDEVLRLATQEDRAVLTLNRLDFHRLHSSSQGLHAGIITCTRDPDLLALAGRIHQAVQALPQLTGELVRVARGGQSAGTRG